MISGQEYPPYQCHLVFLHRSDDSRKEVEELWDSSIGQKGSQESTFTAASQNTLVNGNAAIETSLPQPLRTWCKCKQEKKPSNKTLNRDF